MNMEDQIKEWKLFLDNEIAKYLFALSLGVLSLPPEYRVPICLAVYFFILSLTYKRGKFMRDINRLKNAKHNPLLKLRFKRLVKPLSFKNSVLSVSPFFISILFFTFVCSTGA